MNFILIKDKSQTTHPLPIIDTASNIFIEMKNRILDFERIILTEISYETFRLIETPYKYIFPYLKYMRCTPEVARKAWYYLNDSYNTTLCIHFPPNSIAISCIYLAMRMLKVPMPSYSFWILMETPINKISEIASWILPIYSSIKKKGISDLKNIYERIYQTKQLDKKYECIFDKEGNVKFENAIQSININNDIDNDKNGKKETTNEITIRDKASTERKTRDERRKKSKSYSSYTSESDSSSSYERRRNKKQKDSQRNRNESKVRNSKFQASNRKKEKRKESKHSSKKHRSKKDRKRSNSRKRPTKDNSPLRSSKFTDSIDTYKEVFKQEKEKVLLDQALSALRTHKSKDNTKFPTPLNLSLPNTQPILTASNSDENKGSNDIQTLKEKSILWSNEVMSKPMTKNNGQANE